MHRRRCLYWIRATGVQLQETRRGEGGERRQLTGEKADEEKLTAGAPPSPRPFPSPAVTSRARTPLSWIRSWTLEVRIDSGVERAGMTRFHSGNDDSGPDPILNRVTLFRPD